MCRTRSCARASPRPTGSRSPSSSGTATARRSGSSSALLDPREIDFELDARTRGSIAHATLARFFAQLPAEVGVERLSRDDLPAAYALMRRCLGDALAGQRVPDSVAGKELARGARARPGRVPARGGRPRAPARAAPVRGPVRRPDVGPGAEGGPGDRRLRRHRPDRPHRHGPGDVSARARVGLQVGRERPLGRRDGPRGPAADPALHPRAARPARDRADRRHVPGAGREAGRARARARRRDRLGGARSGERRRCRRVLGADRASPGAWPRRRSPGCARAACGTIPAGASAHRGAPSTRSAGWPRP